MSKLINMPSTLTALATRIVISRYMRIRLKQALVFNSVDMLMSALIFKVLNEKVYKRWKVNRVPITLLSSRVISLIVGVLVTSATVGSLRWKAALVLSAASFVFGFIMFLETGIRSPSLVVFLDI